MTFRKLYASGIFAPSPVKAFAFVCCYVVFVVYVLSSSRPKPVVGCTVYTPVCSSSRGLFQSMFQVQPPQNYAQPTMPDFAQSNVSCFQLYLCLFLFPLHYPFLFTVLRSRLALGSREVRNSFLRHRRDRVTHVRRFAGSRHCIPYRRYNAMQPPSPLLPSCSG